MTTRALTWKRAGPRASSRRSRCRRRPRSPGARHLVELGVRRDPGAPVVPPVWKKAARSSGPGAGTTSRSPARPQRGRAPTPRGGPRARRAGRRPAASSGAGRARWTHRRSGHREADSQRTGRPRARRPRRRGPDPAHQVTPPRDPTRVHRRGDARGLGGQGGDPEPAHVGRAQRDRVTATDPEADQGVREPVTRRPSPAWVSVRTTSGRRGPPARCSRPRRARSPRRSSRSYVDPAAPLGEQDLLGLGERQRPTSAGGALLMTRPSPGCAGCPGRSPRRGRDPADTTSPSRR